MFRNRHLNFGYLSVIVVTFVIAISASCKLTYAEKEEEQIDVIQITLNADTGNVISVVGGEMLKSKGLTTMKMVGSVERGDEIDFDADNIPDGRHVKKIIPCVIFTSDNHHCITIWIDGYPWRYCPKH